MTGAAPAKLLFLSLQTWDCPGAWPFAPGGSQCQLFIANVVWEWQKGLGVPVVIGCGPASLDTGRFLETCYQRVWGPGRQQQWVLAHQQGPNLEKKDLSS